MTELYRSVIVNVKAIKDKFLWFSLTTGPF